MITFDQFKQMDIRIAKITAVENHPNADKLYLVTVETGDGTKKLVAGIREHYTAEELIGRLRGHREDYERTLGAAQQTSVDCHRTAIAAGDDGLLPADAWRDVTAMRLVSASEDHGVEVATWFKGLSTPDALHLEIVSEEPDRDGSATLADRQACKGVEKSHS